MKLYECGITLQPLTAPPAFGLRMSRRRLRTDPRLLPRSQSCPLLAPHAASAPGLSASRLLCPSARPGMEKVYFTPQPMVVRTHHPPTYENGFFTPELSKTRQITP
jgi:hypothetical protein